MPTSQDHEVYVLEPRSPPDAWARPHRGRGPGQSVPNRPSGQTAHGRQKTPLSGQEERALPEPGHTAGTSDMPSPLARPPEQPSRVATTPENLQRPWLRAGSKGATWFLQRPLQREPRDPQGHRSEARTLREGTQDLAVPPHQLHQGPDHRALSDSPPGSRGSCEENPSNIKPS